MQLREQLAGKAITDSMAKLSSAKRKDLYGEMKKKRRQAKAIDNEAVTQG